MQADRLVGELLELRKYAKPLPSFEDVDEVEESVELALADDKRARRPSKAAKPPQRSTGRIRRPDGFVQKQGPLEVQVEVSESVERKGGGLRREE